MHHLGGPPEWIEAQQHRGWRDALDAAGAKGTAPVRGDWSARSGYELGRELLELPDLTAIFVANDQMALGLLRALNERAVRSRATSASSASTTSPRRRTSARR